ncbi:Imm26 family immunity protein [Rhizobium sp. SG741]|uniref:Imm26 family immunity protein n=1 Tax=Rhizobium sp. SG741 TaxID=2587114 RepID=UPI0014488E7B|nr:Imm26 family immunity protein [Rhizobium sp. SG741]NKJ09010.1 hypothetical protein [Rhizobium sp. SG741]
MNSTRKIRRKRGDIVKIQLENGYFTYALALKSPLFAFFDIRTKDDLSVSDICKSKVIFALWVMDYAVTKGVWAIYDHVVLPAETSLEDVIFYKQDKISGKIYSYSNIDCSEHPITFEETEGKEAAAVWDPSHVEDRLRDYFAGAPNKWVQSLKARRLE